MEIHIGKIVKAEMQRVGMKQNVFAEKINYSPGNISTLLKQADWPISKVIRASDVLGTNLFTHFISKEEYSNNVINESQAQYHTTGSMQIINCRSRVKELEESIELYKSQVKMLNEKIASLQKT